MANWKDNEDEMALQADKNFFSHPIDNLELDPFKLEPQSHSNCNNLDPFKLEPQSHSNCNNLNSAASDPFSINTLKVELGELQDGDTTSPEEIAERFSYAVGSLQSLSLTTKQNNVTYLNKGQTYEFTMNCNSPTLYSGYMIESNVLLRLQEKRFQAKEKDMFDQWFTENNCRLLEADTSQSVNCESVTNDTLNTNSVHVVWNPAKACSLFFKVHCLSGDFTKRKHSGEKGVPFLLSVDTYVHKTEKPSRYLCTAACVLKIYQNKGAERKHRDDTRRFSRLTEEEKGQLASPPSVTTLKPILRASDVPNCSGYSDTYNTSGCFADNSKLSDNYSDPDNELNCPKKPCIGERDTQTLTTRSSVHDTHRWLRHNRFNSHLRTFNNYSGFDLLRLSRHDIKDLIGATDGIRLHNALQSKSVTSKLCIYVKLEGAPNAVHHGVYLETLTYRELVGKLCSTFSLDTNAVLGAQKTGPNGISVAITDDVIRHMDNEACFTCCLLSTDQADMYVISLK